MESNFSLLSLFLTDVPTADSDPTENLWMYVYTATGIVAFVIIVIIISVASMRGCKGDLFHLLFSKGEFSFSKIKCQQVGLFK